MAYGDTASETLKSCFKYYKLLRYDTNVVTSIESSFRNMFLESVIDFQPSSNEVISEDHIYCTSFSLPNQGFFVIRRSLPEDLLQRLLHSSVIEWTALSSKACNLDLDCHDSVDLWASSVTQVANGESWSQTSMGKLRWITLGYHYQWTDRGYDETKRGIIPPLLSKVSLMIVTLLRTRLVSHCSVEFGSKSEFIEACDSFCPEAAIVNYYRGKTTMGFHSDEVEFDKKAPLVSISLGRPGLYLLEIDEPVVSSITFPHTLDVPEAANIVPVILRHGDVVVMLGKSRLAKHAVPAVLTNELIDEDFMRASVEQFVRRACTHCSIDLSDRVISCASCTLFVHYVMSTRVNINVRQVVPSGYQFSDFKIS